MDVANMSATTVKPRLAWGPARNFTPWQARLVSPSRDDAPKPQIYVSDSFAGHR